jgi:hypothetical protein
MPPRRRGKSPGRKATKELREKADELGVDYPDDVNHDVLAKSLRWWRRLSGLKFVITTAVAFGFYQWWTFCDRDCRAEKAILKPRSLLENVPDYVPRPFFEAQLAPHVAHAGQDYIVVVGPRGAGKSRVVDAVVANRPGVLPVDLGESQSVVEAIFSSLGENLVSDFPERSANVLKDLFKRVAERYRSQHPADARLGADARRRSAQRQGWTGDGLQRRDGRQEPQHTDKRWCRVILVLSDADAAFGLPSDGFRQTLVWVDDFTIDEANQFFDNVGCLPLRQRFDANNTDLNDHLRRRWFEFVGTRPAALEFVANQLARVPIASLDERVDALISEQMEDATDVLGNLFKQSASPSGAEFQRPG